MKSVTNFFIAISIYFALQVTQIYAQTREAETAILRGKKLLQEGVTKWDIDVMLQGRALFERLNSEKDFRALIHYYIGYADYRVSIFYSQKDKDKALKYLDDAISHLEKATQFDNRFAEAFALLSGCYGQKIGYKPILAMMLGPKSGQMMEAAFALEPGNPRIVMLDAISKLFTPPMFGGSREKALAGFQKSAELFAKFKAKSSLMPNWGNEEVYAWLGVVYIQKKQYDLAKQALERALKINPAYVWVKNELMPQVVQKH